MLYQILNSKSQKDIRNLILKEHANKNILDYAYSDTKETHEIIIEIQDYLFNNHSKFTLSFNTEKSDYFYFTVSNDDYANGTKQSNFNFYILGNYINWLAPRDYKEIFEILDKKWELYLKEPEKFTSIIEDRANSNFKALSI